MNIEHKLYKAVREIVSSHDIIGHTFSESAIGENDEYDAEIYKRYNQGRLYLANRLFGYRYTGSCFYLRSRVVH